uniref:SSD domain-containing protein n=1 Tax=Romanomermis culicivorax TaxID=13658 RepID=A0A915K2H5_ROMCU
MCVGIDNDFLLMAAWRQTDPSKESRIRLGESLMEAGPSLTITSATDIMCFLIGCISGTPAVSSFCLFTATSLSFRYIYQMTFYAAIMIFEGRCDEKHLNHKNHSTVFIEKKFSNYLPCKSVLELVNRRRHSPTTVPRSEYFMHKFFRIYWARFLMLKAVRVGGACLLAAYVAFSLCKASLFIVNITPERIITDDSPMVKIFQNAEKFYWPYNAVGHIFVLSPPDFRNATNRRRMSAFISRIEKTEYFTTSPQVGTTVWFRDYLNYLNFLISADSDDDYWPEFYQHLESFLLTGDNSKFISDIYFTSDHSTEGEPNIEKFQFRSFFQNVTTWNDHVELMLHWRRACAKFPEFNALVADHSSLNPYLDQRLSLSPTTLQTMGVALLSMTVVTGLFMPDVIGIFYITLSFISVDIGVIGFLQVWNCDLDPATLTGIVMTIGFSVYYTARVCYNYQCADKNLDAEGKMRCTMGAVVSLDLSMKKRLSRERKTRQISSDSESP